MVRNVSFKADDDFDDKLYSISKKKGMTKSAYIKHEVGKLIEAEEGGEISSNKNFPNFIPNSDSHVDILKEEKKTNFMSSTEESQVQSNNLKKTSSIPINLNVNSPINSSVNTPNDSSVNELKNLKDLNKMKDLNETMNEEKKDIIKIDEEKKDSMKIEKKEELNELSTLKNIKEEVSMSRDNVNRLDDLLITKTSTSKIIPIDQSKQSETTKSKTRAKFVIRKKVNRVNDEENVTTGLTERDIEHRLNKLLEEKKFNESFRDMHGKVDKVCEDGKCLKDKVNSLELKLEKIDDICEDGKCIKNEVSVIRNDLKELKDFKKNFDDIKGSVGDIKSFFSNLDKKITKKEACPTCSLGIEEGSSYCPNCGLEIKEWYDDSGNKLNWTPYKVRHQH